METRTSGAVTGASNLAAPVALLAALTGCGRAAHSTFDACALLPEAAVQRAMEARVLTSSPGSSRERVVHFRRITGPVTSTVEVEQPGTCEYVLTPPEGRPLGPKDVRLVSGTLAAVDPGEAPRIFSTLREQSGVDAAVGKLGRVRERPVPGLGVRAEEITFSRGRTVRVLALGGGRLAFVDVQNGPRSAAPSLARRLLAAAPRR